MSTDFLERFKHKSNKLGRNGEIIVSDDFKVRKDLNIAPILYKHLSNSTIKAKTQFSSRFVSPRRPKPYLGGVMDDVNNTLKTLPSSRALYQESNSEFNNLPEKLNRDIGGGVNMSDRDMKYYNRDQDLRTNRDRVAMPHVHASYQNLNRDFHIGSYENVERCRRYSKSIIIMKPEGDKKESLYKVQKHLGVGTSFGENEIRNSKLDVKSKQRNFSQEILKQRGLHLKGIENTYNMLKQKEMSYFLIHKAPK